VEVERVDAVPGFRCQTDDPAYAAARRALEEAYGKPPGKPAAAAPSRCCRPCNRPHRTRTKVAHIRSPMTSEDLLVPVRLADSFISFCLNIPRSPGTDDARLLWVAALSAGETCRAQSELAGDDRLPPNWD
jgi:hypothetical protein